MSSEMSDFLVAPAGKDTQRHVNYDGADIHFRLRRTARAGAPLVIRFHGAVQRDKRELPAFQANLAAFDGVAHQISVCDPTMMARDGFSCSWYAGTEDLDVQRILGRFLGEVQDTLEPSRTIYLGSSGGGFGALYHSYHDPGSIALVMVPQTNLRQHFVPAAVKRYLDACWSGRTLDEVAELTCVDLPGLYSAGYGNTVIYVQSQGDFRHNALQLKPFMGACLQDGDPSSQRFILASDYWGKPGHGGAVPAEGYTPWLRAALDAASPESEDVLAAYSAIRSRDSSGEPVPKPASARGFTPADFSFAQNLTRALKGNS
ncbi:MAG: hypothetical protein Q4F65_01465 [Propionibacteriaceae bacterium]|nr:hypothetical protein [Propionibacteriaceae bacterium]